MPNYVTNILEFKVDGPRLNEILNAIKHDEGELGSFDFNKILPMPTDLNMTEGSITTSSIEAFISHIRSNTEVLALDHAKFIRYQQAAVSAFRWPIPKPNFDMTQEGIKKAADLHDMSVDAFLALGKKYLDNQIAYGATTWYNWCVTNWGTKWNLGPEDCSLATEQSLNFYTAWSAPLPIVEALSKRFPEVEMKLQWADEDLGYNVGTLTYKDGEVIDGNVPEPGSKEAYDMAFAIESAKPEDFSMTYDENSGTYVFMDELDTAKKDTFVSLDDQLAGAKQKSEIQASDISGKGQSLEEGR